jgi:hypothetical protein
LVPDAFELGIELLARDARLNAAIEIGLVDFQYAAHLRQIDAHAAIKCRDVAFE